MSRNLCPVMSNGIERGLMSIECHARDCAWYDSDRECCGMLPDNAVTTDAALRKHLLWLDGRITDLEGERKEQEAGDDE